jgi:tRNA (guanine-N7-)-methyltransferase
MKNEKGKPTMKQDKGAQEFSFDPWGPGNYLIKLRNGEDVSLKPYNKYLFLAKDMTDVLYTRPEVAEWFPNVFEDPALPVVIEIGCCMGDTVVELAKQNPEFNILGVDIKYKRVVRSSNKIKRAGLANAKIAIADARELIAVLPDESLFGMVAFFPDPWQKIKQAKHRFLNDWFFQMAAKKLKAGGFIWVKTDNKPYMEEVSERAKGFHFLLEDRLPLGRPLIGASHRTFFEQLFTRLQQPIYQLYIRKA